MLNKIHKLLKATEIGLTYKDIEWKKLGFRFRQVIAIVPRIVALPFFVVGIVLVLIAIIPASVADHLQKLADKVAR
ncbi:MAG: hypothetical protein [Bacteriophage sp.]|nr:MAG: hypothetical protein [Bacteriophage sp.]